MQIHVLINNNQIVEVNKASQSIHEAAIETPSIATPINGKYLIPVVQGVDFPIDKNSYVVNDVGVVDQQSVISQSFAHLLAKYPLYDTIYFNPLITADHVGEIDLSATFPSDVIGYPPPIVNLPTRIQTGRYTLGADAGQMPTHTALLSCNAYTTPYHPGILVTQNLDISAYTDGIGTDEFCVYWQLVGFTISQDIASNYGITNGINDPVIREVFDVSQEPTGFAVYMSPDNGVHWCPVNFLEPINFRDKTTAFRLAFVNLNTDRKIYLVSFAAMF
jgi:hypothetical protein